MNPDQSLNLPPTSGYPPTQPPPSLPPSIPSREMLPPPQFDMYHHSYEGYYYNHDTYHPSMQAPIHYEPYPEYHYPMPPVRPKYESFTLKITGLSSRISQRDVRRIFSVYGVVRNIDFRTKYTLVEYEFERDAYDAVQNLNGIVMDTNRIRVQFYTDYEKSNCYRVIVKQLAYSVTWQQLKDHFRKSVRDVKYAHIVKDSRGRSEGFGIVEFKSKEDMEKAIRELNDSDLNGRRIYIKEDNENLYHKLYPTSPPKRFSSYPTVQHGGYSNMRPTMNYDPPPVNYQHVPTSGHPRDYYY
jgi:RNA recognition motif-containing protein